MSVLGPGATRRPTALHSRLRERLPLALSKGEPDYRKEAMRNTNEYDIADVLREAGVDREQSGPKADLLVEGYHLATSGKMAAGKDAVADAVEEILQPETTAHVSMAGPLKAEISMMLRAYDAKTPLEEVAKATGVKLGLVKEAFSLLKGQEPGATGYTRTVQVRGLLQFWGTDVRRAMNPDYWTRLGIRALADATVPGAVSYTHLTLPTICSV